MSLLRENQNNPQDAFVSVLLKKLQSNMIKFMNQEFNLMKVSKIKH